MECLNKNFRIWLNVLSDEHGYYRNSIGVRKYAGTVVRATENIFSVIGAKDQKLFIYLIFCQISV